MTKVSQFSGLSFLIDEKLISDMLLIFQNFGCQNSGKGFRAIQASGISKHMHVLKLTCEAVSLTSKYISSWGQRNSMISKYNQHKLRQNIFHNFRPHPRGKPKVFLCIPFSKVFEFSVYIYVVTKEQHHIFSIAGSCSSEWNIHLISEVGNSCTKYRYCILYELMCVEAFKYCRNKNLSKRGVCQSNKWTNYNVYFYNNIIEKKSKATLYKMSVIS